MSAREFFLGKRIAVIGLGPHGEMVADVRYLIKANALVSVYDIRAESRVLEHVNLLRSIGLANHVCGTVPPDDLLDMDLIILSHEYPRDSSCLSEARKKGIPIEYPETLFLKIAPPVMVVGVMGTCGKTTVVSMLAPMLESICVHGISRNFIAGSEDGSDLNSEREKHALFLADPDSGKGILANLKDMKTGDLVLMRITEFMMTEITSLRWSPQIAVFTSVPQSGIHGGSPFAILTHQTYNSHVIGNDPVIDAVRSATPKPTSKMLRTKASLVPDDWAFKGRAPHDREDAALALQAARLLKVSDMAAREVLEKWKPLKGRLEPVKKVKQIEFYNDSASVSPEATVSGISSVGNKENRNVVLIAGGADAGADYRQFCAAVPQYVHSLIVVPGSGTLRERGAFRLLDHVDVISVPSIEEATRSALDHAKKGDCVLFSPGFAAGGFDGSRLERGERFVKAVRALS